MQYYLDIVYLEGCPHSKAARNLVESNNIKHNLITVSHYDKDKYKTSLISTFPQIYLKKNNNKGSLLLGGNSDLQQIHNIIKNNKDPKETRINLIKYNKNINNKLSLRILELFENTQVIY